MPRRIEEDHSDFRDVYAGRLRRELRRWVDNGQIFKSRPKGGKFAVTVPKINIPYPAYGSSGNGIGRGEGEPGDTIKKGKGDGDGGNGAGSGSSEGVTVSVDLDEVLDIWKETLKLPDLKPKPNETFEEIKIKYNDLSLTGPESLRHNRKTYLQALKRLSAMGEAEKLHQIPGFADPVRMITPINSDRRYRQYKEIKVPSSNAVVFFARDGSASMGPEKCEIVSDMAWWIDVWIRRFYKRVERCYVWHDSAAMEVDEDKFYNYRYGGGTRCSTALNLIAKQFKNRFPPNKWNIYIFYFSDGDNWSEDNNDFIRIIKNKFPKDVVNLFGFTQILPWHPDYGLKKVLDDDKSILQHSNMITTEVDFDAAGSSSRTMPDDEKYLKIRKAIQDLLGAKKDEPTFAEGF